MDYTILPEDVLEEIREEMLMLPFSERINATASALFMHSSDQSVAAGYEAEPRIDLGYLAMTMIRASVESPEWAHAVVAELRRLHDEYCTAPEDECGFERGRILKFVYASIPVESVHDNGDR